jgi:hypothetical protein
VSIHSQMVVLGLLITQRFLLAKVVYLVPWSFRMKRKLQLSFVSQHCADDGVRLVELITPGSADIFKYGSGFHFANPIPEEFSIPKSEIDQAINQAVEEAAEQGFHGHANTPFILSRIKELTQGNSVAANRALIESNIKVATKVAVELSKLRLERFKDNDNSVSEKDSDKPVNENDSDRSVSEV